MFSEVPTFNPILPNGVSSFIETVSKQLSEMGHEVHIYEAKSYAEQAKIRHIEGYDITIHRFFSIPMSNYRGIRTPIPIGTLLKGVQDDLDVIHAHGPINGITASALAKFRNIVKVITFHTPGQEYTTYIPGVFRFARLNHFVDFFEKLIYSSFDIMLTPAAAIRRDLIQRGFDGQKIFVLPNCINLNENNGRISEERMQELRDYYNLNGKRVIIYVGRMSPEKRIPEIIQLAPFIVKEEPDVHFLIVGKGPYLETYRAMGQKIVPKNMTFTGYVTDEDLSNLLRLSSLGVIFVENAQVFDITLLNYWANHLAVCARLAGGMGDVINHMENGLLFTNPTEEAYNYILELLQDEKLRKRIGEKGYETVKNKYSVEQVVIQMLNYYKLAAIKYRAKRTSLWTHVLKTFGKL